MAGQSARGGGTSGTYTPTLTNVANCAALVSSACNWSRNGNIVTVAGMIQCDPTTTSIDTQFRMTLPIASNFATSADLGGAGSSGPSAFTESWGIYANASDDEARFRAVPTSNANRFVSFMFQYQVL